MRPFDRLRSAASLLLVAALGLTACGTGPAGAGSADNYPQRPIKVIVPFSAGGGTDLGARLLAKDLERELDGSIVVENREGAGSQTGLTEAANAKPDGYTVAAVNMPAMHTIVLSPERKPQFDLDSFDYLMNHVTEPIVIGVKKDSPYRTLDDLAAAVKKRPNKMRAGTSGALTPEHLAQLQFEQAVSSKLRIAHFDGAAGSMAQFRSGRTDIAFTTPSFVTDVRPLAVLTKERTDAMPGVPTAAEQGYPEMVMESSRGFAVPKGVPEPVLTKLRDAFEKVASSKKHQTKAKKSKLSVNVITGKKYEKYVRTSHKEAKPLVALARKQDGK